MTALLTDRISAVRAQDPTRRLGRIIASTASSLEVCGLGPDVAPGTLLTVSDGGTIEVVRNSDSVLFCAPYQRITEGNLCGDVSIAQENAIRPGVGWLGEILDGLGRRIDLEQPPLSGPARSLFGTAAPFELTHAEPTRIETGVGMIDVMLPLVRGQRIGLFAGPGVGKTNLLAQIAAESTADAIVLALVGERRQEAARFLTALPETVRSKMVAIVSPCDDAPGLRRRAMLLAMTVAEALRDEAQDVLFLGDSLTRHLDAHRDLALAAGEPAGLGGYPPSMTAEVARLAERAGAHQNGSITAIWTVLAPASDLDGPVPDCVRAVLDGHIILDRALAQEGRFPAIDLLASVSRALPDAVDADWNMTITQTRKLLDDAEGDRTLVKAGLLERGKDLKRDHCLDQAERIDALLRRRSEQPPASLLQQICEILEATQ